MITETLLTDLCGALDMVVLERRKEDVFRIIGKLPDWFAHLYPEAAVDRNAVRPGAMSAFLPYFLMDAKAFWQQRGIGWLRSGPWSEGQNADFLEAKVTCLGDREILYIQRLGPAYQEARSLLQQTREIRLDYENLLRTHEALRRSQAESRALLNAMPDSLWRISLDGGCIDLQAMGKSNRTEPAASAAQKLMDLLARHEKSQTDLLTILSQLRLATVLLDEQGKITFLSPICLRILEKSPEQLLGRPWTEICPFAEAEKARLCEMLLRPQRERSRLSVHLDIPSGRHLWLEIDVRDDPRDPRWRIVFLCDRSEVPELHRLLREGTPFRRLIGNSKPMRRIYQAIRALAQVDTPVLIEGETGTGKELVARELHAKSRRKDDPFIVVNCAALTESLLASQLFGHKRGAFTGAIADQPGVFECAHGGTLFLDEIGDMPLSMQASFLRVLEDHEIVRLGESKPRKVDVRILTATHHDLQEAVAKGTFRADLLFRIRIARLCLPPLREHLEDLPLLVNTFLAHYRAVIGKPVEGLSAETLALLQSYHWPGNVRELKSAIEFAVIRCQGSMLCPDDLPPEISNISVSSLPPPTPTADEKQRLLNALQRAKGNRTAAARLLGMSRATFYRHMAQYGILRDI